MSGYNGYSKSNNAVEAEDCGRYPMTTAVKIVAQEAGCIQKEARKALEEIGHCEWHHTSKKYNVTYYYDTKKAIDLIKYGEEENAEDIAEEELRTEAHRKQLERQADCDHEFLKQNYKCGLSKPLYCHKCGYTDWSRKYALLLKGTE